MILKFISLATAIVTLDVYLQSQLYSSDPLFLFASNNPAVNLALVVLVSLTAVVSFKRSFKYWQSYVACTSLAILLGGFGFAGTFFSTVTYSFPSFLLPLDYLLLLETGIVLGICTLSFQHQKIPYQIQMPQLSSIFNKLVFPLPKIPQSPSNFSPTSTTTTGTT